MLSSFFLFIFSTFPVQAQELSCGTGTVTKMVFGQKQTQNVSLCYNENRGTLFSVSCAKKNCDVFKKPERFLFKEIYSEMGSPGFEVCRRLQGVPEIITVDIADKSFPADRCVFPNGDFADTGSVFKFYVR